MVQTDAPEALQAEFHAKQYKYARPSIEEKPWSKEMTISDPFGNRLIFTSPDTIEART